MSQHATMAHRLLSQPIYHATLLLALGCSAASSTHAAGDAKLGQAMHDKQCVNCHVRQVGGDGSRVYTRPDRKIASLSALRQRVAFCSNQTNAGWFPEDEEHVTAWLNQQYYKFSK